MNVDIPVLRHAPRSRSLGCAPYLVIALLLSGMAPATLRRLTTESMRTAYEANGRDPWTAFGIAKRYEEDGDAVATRYFELFLEIPCNPKGRVQSVLRTCLASAEGERPKGVRSACFSLWEE